MDSESLESRLTRLARERDTADRAYNDALTEVDRAALPDRALPPLPAEFDDQQIGPLNEGCNVIVSPPPATGLKGRLTTFVWRLIGPTLERQNTFNSRLVDHINRNAAAERETRAALVEMIHALRAHLDAVLRFQSRLLVCLQQVTPYVDTKDRETGGQALIVNAAVNALADDVAKRRESGAVRDQRLTGQVAAIAASQDELRALVSLTQQATMTLKREVERATAASGSQLPASGSQLPTSDPRPPTSGAAFTPALDAYKYVGFEDQFRGSRDVIRARMESYVPFFEGASGVLDVGCGRGEFLELLRAKGIAARGLDLNHEMVELCRAAGLAADEGDVVSYLDALPDASLGGLFAAQVVEHLQPAYLLRFLELANHKLRPGAPIVLETLNPACWTAFFDSFIRDITHVWPLHPETLRYLVLASGFSTSRIEYRSPVAPQDRLQPTAAGEGIPAELAETLNTNIEKLNARLFSYLDYAIIGRR